MNFNVTLNIFWAKIYIPWGFEFGQNLHSKQADLVYGSILVTEL